jgi:hypothetical protein
MSEETNNEVDAIESTLAEEAAVAELVEAYEEAVAAQAAKIEEASEPEDAITLPETKAEQPKLAPLEDGVLGSKPAVKVEKKKTVKPKVEGETVAVYSKRNISWTYVGELIKGYNIVPEAMLEKWLTRDGVRIATPEEVAKEFGL